jgi:hypothetical protein
MSAQLRSRAFEEGRVKALRRMKKPLLEPDRSQRHEYIQSRSAQRRADRMALQHLLRASQDEET